MLGYLSAERREDMSKSLSYTLDRIKHLTSRIDYLRKTILCNLSENKTAKWDTEDQLIINHRMSPISSVSYMNSIVRLNRKEARELQSFLNHTLGARDE